MSILHVIRKDGEGRTKSVRLTQRSAILAFCHECVGFNHYEVELCTDPLCPLYPFRNPKARKSDREVSEKSIQALQKARLQSQESKQTSK